MNASSTVHSEGSTPSTGKTPSAADKAMIILAALTSSLEALHLAEVSRRTGLPKATVHRLLGTLCEHNVVARTGDRYFPVPPAFGVHRENSGDGAFLTLLRSESTPYLVELHNLTAATATLSVLINGRVHHVNQIYGHRGVRLVAGPGTVPPAVDLVLRAYDRVSSRATVSQELQEIRRTGIACSTTSPCGVSGVAVPLCSHDSFAHAPVALSLVARTGRFDTVQAAKELRRAAYELTRSIRRLLPAAMVAS